MKFKFLVGQCIEFCPTGSVAGRYHVLRVMPVEPYHQEPCYHIKGELRGDEWVVTECNLDGNVGSAPHYELIAQQLRDLRRRPPAEAPTQNSESAAIGQGKL